MQTHRVVAEVLPPTPSDRKLNPGRPLSDQLQFFFVNVGPWLAMGLIWLGTNYIRTKKVREACRRALEVPES
jgi:hypothetical protein